MKPIILRMKNIGPYLDEKIDFSKLGNMFLIKGDTGSGKTFIFDAITFALYGELSGNRKNHEKNLKSRYATEDEDSFVEFEFESNGKKYFVERSVPFEYTNRNGKVSKKTMEVSFSEIKNEKKEDFFGKSSEINEKIKKIIGLEAKEFTQIILLPQGKFAEFLHKNSSERAESLKTLFPVDFYTQITEEISEKYKKASDNQNILQGQIQAIESEGDFSNAEVTIQNQEEEISRLKENEEKIQKKLTEFASKKTDLNHNLEDAKEFEENKKLLEKLKLQEDDFKNLEKKIQNAQKALCLKEFINSAENEKENKILAEKNLEIAKNENLEAEKKFEDLNQKKDEMKNLSEKNKNDDGELRVLNQKIEDAKDLPKLKERKNHLETQNHNAEKTIKEIQNQIEEEKENLNKIAGKIASTTPHNDAVGLCNDENSTIFDDKKSEKSEIEILNEINENLKSLRENQNNLKIEKDDCKKRDKLIEEKSNAQKDLQEFCSKLEIENEKFERTKATIDELEKKEKEQTLQNQAFSLSALLKENSACPVCGSKNHPFPAKKPEGLLNFSEQIRTHKGNLDTLQNAILLVQNSISALNQKIENYETQLLEIRTKKSEAEVDEEINKNQLKIDEFEKNQKQIQETSENIKKFENQLDDEKNKKSQIEKEFLEINAKCETLEKSLGEDFEIVIQKRDDLKVELKKNKKIFDEWENSFKNAETQKEKSKAKFEECKKNAEFSAEKCDKATENLLSEVEKSVFKTVEEAKSALMENEEIENATNRCNDFKSNLRSAEDFVQNGKKKNLKTVVEIQTELENCEKLEEEQNQKNQENKKLFDEKNRENATYKDKFENLKKLKNQFETLENEIKPLKLLSNDLEGKNPQKLKFENWALAMYFEQVVNFASERFFDISGGRFSFELKEEKADRNKLSGLDLKVFDSHSGKYSDPAELSGGETFEASISLALALTDVVQNSTGGIGLDSLFIDEGFGTLDAETLEKAMAVLSELSGSKMIGMISHVSEMEDFPDIKSCIKVNKTNQNSTVEIVNSLFKMHL